jgi:hypothetical protein
VERVGKDEQLYLDLATLYLNLVKECAPDNPHV